MVNVFFLIVLHFGRLLSTVAFKIRLALFRAITLNVSVQTCYWASLRTQTHFRSSFLFTRYFSGGEISDDRKYACVRRLVRAMPIQEIPSIHVKKDKMIDGTHRRPCQPRPQGKRPRDEVVCLPCQGRIQNFF